MQFMRLKSAHVISKRYWKRLLLLRLVSIGYVVDIFLCAVLVLVPKVSRSAATILLWRRSINFYRFEK